VTDPEPHDFEVLYRNTAKVPWDTKAPKETVVEWQQSGLVRGDVLDIGCGLGDNAIYLAQQGHRVTALDVAPTALITAERRAIDAHVDVRFAVSDATELAGYTEAFDTVVDSGMYHCLDDADKARYAAAVHRATRPGATLLLSAFSDANAESGDWPRPMVSEQTLRDTLDWWRGETALA
jgi:2-polyprenyl-3-methyl-5-hydroxy-6-metoxy-1,4-benzoquinol methylase